MGNLYSILTGMKWSVEKMLIKQVYVIFANLPIHDPFVIKTA